MQPISEKHSYTAAEILSGIADRDKVILKYLYNNYLPMIIDLAIKNSGTMEDGKDVFHEALISVYEKTQISTFTIEKSFKSYFYGVCRNLWLMSLRKQKKEQMRVTDMKHFDSGESETLEQVLMHERFKLMRKHFQLLGDGCQKILRSFLEGTSLATIASSMGFTAAYAKKRKHICQKKLIESIEKDPLYNELLTK